MHIGHTYLTHSPLVKKEDPPQYTAWDSCLTVKHILFDWVDFIESGNKHITVNSCKELSEKVPLDRISSYLDYIDLLYRNAFLYICMYVCLSVCTHVCLYVRMYVRTYVCIYVNE